MATLLRIGDITFFTISGDPVLSIENYITTTFYFYQLGGSITRNVKSSALWISGTSGYLEITGLIITNKNTTVSSNVGGTCTIKASNDDYNVWFVSTGATASGDVECLVPYFYSTSEWDAYIQIYVPPAIVANGGGATHIAKRTGLLKDLSSYTSNILLVAGGGGGGLIIGEDTYAGKDAGGISGSGNNSANQTTGYAFGQGESGEGVSGGGGGLYGGYKGGTS